MTAPLADLRVIDVSSVVAGPGVPATWPTSAPTSSRSSVRTAATPPAALGWSDPRDGTTLWWKLLGRGKRTIALDLKDSDDLAVMLRLCDAADVLVENFRPGTLERLGLGPDVLLARNPGLVVTRVTGFGQDGPYASRPGFATHRRSDERLRRDQR